MKAVFLALAILGVMAGAAVVSGAEGGSGEGVCSCAASHWLRGSCSREGPCPCTCSCGFFSGCSCSCGTRQAVIAEPY